MDILVEHNAPFAAVDHGFTLFWEMFPDSRIAQSFHCGRAKATALIQHQGEKFARKIACQAMDTFQENYGGTLQFPPH